MSRVVTHMPDGGLYITHPYYGAVSPTTVKEIEEFAGKKVIEMSGDEIISHHNFIRGLENIDEEGA